MMGDKGCRCSALADADIGSKAANGSRWQLGQTAFRKLVGRLTTQRSRIVASCRSCCLLVGLLNTEDTWSRLASRLLFTSVQTDRLIDGCSRRGESEDQK